MIPQTEHANTLKSLHVKGDPLILFNIWDAGSAKTLQEIGAKVIAAGSWSVAAAHGYDDGEKLPFELVVANLKRITARVELPVTLDLEAGYGQSPSQVQATFAKIIEAGVAGINFEDQIIGGNGLYSIDQQCARIKALREVADRASIPIFINARTDIFFKTELTNHDEGCLEEAFRRICAYAEAGANGFFVPGLKNAELIRKLCDFSPIPINIMIMPDTPSPKKLAELGVARISYGPGPYCEVMNALKEAGKKALSMD